MRIKRIYSRHYRFSSYEMIMSIFSSIHHSNECYNDISTLLERFQNLI